MKKDLRVVKTKNNLQETLVQLLTEKSLDKISISELCKVANINRGTFYLHYKDIPGLFDELFDEVTEDLKKAYYEPFLLTANRIHKLTPNMVRIFHHVLKYPTFYKVVFDRKTPMMYFYRLYEVIYDYIQETSRVAHDDDIKVMYHASHQTNAIVGMVIRWVHRNYQETPEALNVMLLEFSKAYFEGKEKGDE
jgi:AcrR family transcriptional regulator